MYRYLQIINYFDHNLRNKTDLEEPILRMFIGANPNDSSEGVISKLYKEVMKKKFQTTEYVKQEGTLLILPENCLDMLNFRRKCTNSSMARIWLEVLHLFKKA